MPSFANDIVVSSTATETARYERMRYFNRLFLEEREFAAEQSYFLNVRRFLNYMLFDEGRLFEIGGTPPLQVSSPGAPPMRLNVSAGAAMIRDTTHRFGYEVRLEAQSIDLSGAGLTHTQTFPVILAHSDAQITAPAGGAGIASTQPDRVLERGVVYVVTPGETPPTGPQILLANVLATSTAPGAGAGTPANTLTVTNFAQRGGVRLEILSQAVMDRLAAPAPSAPVLGSFLPMAIGTAFSRITGSNFATPLTLTFPIAGPPGSTQVVSIPDADVTATEIRVQRALLPATVIRGPVRVTVPGFAGVGPSTFDFVPPPTITNISPTSRSPGQLLTITGTNLNQTAAPDPGVAVTFNPYAAANTRSPASLPVFPNGALGESVSATTIVTLVVGTGGLADAAVRVRTQGGEVASTQLLHVT